MPKKQLVKITARRTYTSPIDGTKVHLFGVIGTRESRSMLGITARFGFIDQQGKEKTAQIFLLAGEYENVQV